MLYSIFDYKDLCSLDYDIKLPPSQQLTNGILSLKRQEDGNYQVDSLFSTDPQDYLNMHYFPGRNFPYHQK